MNNESVRASGKDLGVVRFLLLPPILTIIVCSEIKLKPYHRRCVILDGTQNTSTITQVTLHQCSNANCGQLATVVCKQCKNAFYCTPDCQVRKCMAVNGNLPNVC
ncbi:hypothetical protein J6590_072833 [Homalodisca vitripennis]|nr:hypothetical protein J6590_072833 [Homalodisca vitripennis]